MNDDKHDPRLGQTVGNVRLERVLGAGGFGVVYAGTHELTGRRVAVKMLHSHLVGNSEIRERFLREARTAAALEHPNVVDVLDMGQSDDGALYLVMEFLTGEPFDVRLSRSALSPREAIGLLLPVMDALACTHELGIVHRDLKPENIFLAEVRGQLVPKLLDFGIAKVTEERLTQTGAAIGTPVYMSPEQLKGSSELGPPSDVWSMAIVIYEALSGRRPFDATSMGALAIQLHTEPPAALESVVPGLPPALTQAIHAALALDPNARPTMRAFAASLAASEQPTDVVSAAPSAPRATNFGTDPTALGPAAALASPSVAQRAAAVSTHEVPASRGAGKSLVAGLIILLLVGGGVAAYLLSSSTNSPAAAAPAAATNVASQPSTPRDSSPLVFGTSDSLAKLAVIWRRLRAEERAVPVRFLDNEDRWSVVAVEPEVDASLAAILTTEFGGTGERYAGQTATGLRPQLMRTTVRLNVRADPNSDSGWVLVLPHDAVVVSFVGEVEGAASDGSASDDDAWAYFVVSRTERGWAKSKFLAPYDGCVPIPRQLVAAHPDAARAIRLSFRVATTQVFERGARTDAYLVSAQDEERTFAAVYAIRNDCRAGDERWSHTFQGHVDELFLSETTNPSAGYTLLFASLHSNTDARAWSAWRLDGGGPVWTETLQSGGRDAADGVSGTRDRALQRHSDRVLLVRRGRDRSWFRWTGGFSPL